MGTKQEVEKRAILRLNQERILKNKLIKYRAKSVGETFVTDIYFCPNKVKSFKEIEMDKVGSYSLRIREQKKNKSSQKSINIKMITNYGDHHSWEEHEIQISSLEGAETILKTIGFKPFCKIEKIRIEFKLGNKNIFFEKIKGFGLGLEIEILTTKEKTKAAKLEIDNFLKILGINNSQIVSKSITNIIMKKRARF
ncbi:MAG: CYTH domain-containing protein [Candidatus Micrarchaeota archaeon]|nr:CYTH domain-containing protein [Candidatus Micrarchaeota archaeon]